MKNSWIFIAAIAFAGTVATPAWAADAAAGQKLYAVGCAACHQLKTFAGKAEADLNVSIKSIVAGRVNHPKKLKLSEADVADVAAYIAAHEPK